MVYDYKILNEAKTETLEFEVVRHLREGWQLRGNTYVIAYPRGDYISYTRYHQTMIKQIVDTDIKQTIGEHHGSE